MTIYTINDKVDHYVGIYAEDERTGFFDPIVPRFSSSNTKQWMFTVPGSHETLVGNHQKDGHSIGFHSFDIFTFTDEFVDELANVGWVTKVISVELLGSEPWGNVQFDWSWSGGQSTFAANYDVMDDYADYEYMRTISTVPFAIASYFSDWIRTELTCHWCNAIDRACPIPANPYDSVS